MFNKTIKEIIVGSYTVSVTENRHSKRFVQIYNHQWGPESYALCFEDENLQVKLPQQQVNIPLRALVHACAELGCGKEILKQLKHIYGDSID